MIRICATGWRTGKLVDGKFILKIYRPQDAPKISFIPQVTQDNFHVLVLCHHITTKSIQNESTGTLQKVSWNPLTYKPLRRNYLEQFSSAKQEHIWRPQVKLLLVACKIELFQGFSALTFAENMARFFQSNSYAPFSVKVRSKTRPEKWLFQLGVANSWEITSALGGNQWYFCRIFSGNQSSAR